MAFTVSHCRSSKVHPKASQHNSISRDMDVPDIKRLSVFRVTRKLSRRSNPIGWSAMDAAAPVCTLLDGHNSSGIRRSRT